MASTGSAPVDPAVAARRAEVARAVAAFRAGKDREESFRVLFQAYHRPLRRFFARKGMKPEDCLDLAQEVFVGIYNGLESFRGDSRFDTWLYRIATTTYLKRLRYAATEKRKGEEVPHDEIAAETALVAPEEQLTTAIGRERREALRLAVAELPDQMRRCLTLRIYQELKYKEIAALMKLSIQTVKVHLFEARRRLHQRLGEELVGPAPRLEDGG